MKKFKLVITILACIIVLSLISFGVYAALRTQLYISNQIEFKTDKTITSLEARFIAGDRTGQGSINWGQPLSTFAANNNSSADGELNNQIWDSEYINPLPDINFNEHAVYKFEIDITADQSEILRISGFNIDGTNDLSSKYNINVWVDGNELDFVTVNDKLCVDINLTKNVEANIEIRYEIIDYKRTINIENDLEVSIVEE